MNANSLLRFDKLTAVRLLTLYALAVVLIGAWTRLADAGLGCPDWPGCYGFLSVPQTEAAIDTANARYPDAPFEAQKAWPEMIHRFVAGFLGLGIFALAAHAWLRAGREEPRWLPLGLAGLVVAQAAFGMWTVTLRLWPQIVTLHLLGGFATLALLWLYSLRLADLQPQPQPRTLGAAAVAAGPAAAPVAAAWPGLATLAALALVAVIGQVALGGWTSSNYAALACPDFPTCQGSLLPDADFRRGFDVSQTIGPNYLAASSRARHGSPSTSRIGSAPWP
jgi:cytochrome c oxidase assembly protein subunit 15